MTRRAIAAVAVALAVAAIGAGQAAPAGAATLDGTHDARYCEILELKGSLPRATVTVWNTIGLNECPATWWDAFEAGPLAAELGVPLVVLNGPRHFLMDSISAPRRGELRTFNGEQMRKAATIRIRAARDLAQVPYTDRTIARDNTWSWRKGRRVFELVAPGGDVYVMQSYAQIRDPGLTLAKLPALGRRLDLPEGWRYRSRRLRAGLDLVADGSATVIQDDLQNTYQLARTVRRGPRAERRLRVEGRTKAIAGGAPGTVEDHGTVTGTPFGKGKIVLAGTLADGRLEGTFRLTYPRGSVVGTVSMPYTVSGNEIDFAGTSRITGGTGIYRGITSGRLTTRDTNTLDGQNGRLVVTGAVKY